MKVYGFSNAPWFQEGQNSLLVDGRGSTFEIINDELTTREYSRLRRIGSLRPGRHLVALADSGLDYNSVLNGECWISDDYGNKVEIEPEVLFASLWCVLTGSRDRVIVDIPTGKYPEKVLFNFEKGERSRIQLDRKSQFMSAKLIDGGVLSYVKIGDVKVRRYSESWELIWEYSSQKDDPDVANYDNTLVLPCGYLAGFVENIKGRTSENGLLCLLNKTDGSVIWQNEYPQQIDSLEKETDDAFIALTSGKMLRLEAATGKVLSEVDTGFGNITRSHYTQIADEYLFAFNSEEHVFHVYDLASFKLIKTKSFKEYSWCLSGRVKLVDRKLYMRMNIGTFRMVLCVIDLDSLDLEPVYEKGLGLKVDVPDTGYASIQITACNESLGDVLRHTELHALTLAEKEGNEGRGLGANKHFNGMIRLTCIGLTDTERFDITDAFGWLKERIEGSARRWGLMCGKRENFITFEYEIK